MLTPATGVIATQHTAPTAGYCDQCGKPIRNSGVWGYPRFVCLNHDCPACPFERECVDTTFPRLEALKAR